MVEAFDVELRGRLGKGIHDLEVIKVLNRVLRVTGNGLLYEADARHAELLAVAPGLQDCKGQAYSQRHVIPGQCCCPRRLAS